jgi:hyperosmotically inducible periplasmic protein
MKLSIIALTVAVAAAACNNGDTKPAKEPVVTTDVPPTSAVETSAAAEPFVATSTPPTGRAPARSGPSGAATPTASPRSSSTAAEKAASDSASSAATTSSQTATAVGNNPGVGDQTKGADNTKLNDRDRHGTLTPMDQGNSGSETKITAAIRKGLMGDGSLSFTAKNVKVITVGAKVTLRGPVKSDQERSAVEAIARQTAGVSEVDNQLEVKK